MMVLALLAGCAGHPPAPGAFQPSRQVAEFCDLLQANREAPIGKLLKPFGKPDRLYGETIPNKHILEASDEINIFQFNDGEVAIYSVPYLNRNFIFRIELTGSFWPDRLPNHIGKDARALIDYFGWPDQKHGNDLVYSCLDTVDQYLHLDMVAGRLRALEVNGWVD